MTDALPNPELVIEARGLVKQYRNSDQAAVDRISLLVRKGEILGLLGPNGAGKTTTISMLASLLRPTAGEITICGHRLGRRSRAVRQLIGLVPQDIALYDQLTAAENLRFFGRLYGLQGKHLTERVAAGLDAMGLTNVAAQRAGTFSGGMKRRLNLAIGLLHEPQLLFLDEPTVGIDAQSRSMILGFLATLGRAGMTMVYTTHYMEEAEQLCSRIAVIDQGRIVADGTRAELLASHPQCKTIEDVFLDLTGRQLRD
jgi:ABC-2 type transport system ATP-binding protein